MKNNKILKIIGTLSLLTITSIAIINKILSTLAVSKKLLEKVKGNYYDWRFGKIFYTKKGTGSPVLLIHGLDACASSYEWNHITEALAKKHTVYTIDLLGCGKSDKPKITYTNYLYVQLVSDFIKNVIGHKTNIIVSGRSCSFVIMACNIDASLFNKIMLINPDTFQDLNQTPKGSAKLIKKLIELPLIGTLLYNILYSRSHIEKRLRETYLTPTYFSTVLPDIYLENAHTNDNCGKYLMSSIKGKFVNINIANALRSIDNSIYLILGEENPDKDIIVASYCECNPAIETFLIPHSKKYTQIERWEELQKQITIFF